MEQRKAKIERVTNETSVSLEINLDGEGKYEVQTPLGFLNHMLELFAKHSRCNLVLKAKGDTQCDDHHLVEDVGIVLGQAIAKALGDKKNIVRYGSAIIPMDDVLCLCAVDLGGRFSFETNYAPQREKVNDFSTEMMRHFFQSVAVSAMMNLHIQFLSPGQNEHHRLEAAFKSFAYALRKSREIDPSLKNSLLSTKGTL